MKKFEEWFIENCQVIVEIIAVLILGGTFILPIMIFVAKHLWQIALG